MSSIPESKEVGIGLLQPLFGRGTDALSVVGRIIVLWFEYQDGDGMSDVLELRSLTLFLGIDSACLVSKESLALALISRACKLRIAGRVVLLEVTAVAPGFTAYGLTATCAGEERDVALDFCPIHRDQGSMWSHPLVPRKLAESDDDANEEV